MERGVLVMLGKEESIGGGDGSVGQGMMGEIIPDGLMGTG